jgi:hypothetical protein
MARLALRPARVNAAQNGSACYGPRQRKSPRRLDLGLFGLRVGS